RRLEGHQARYLAEKPPEIGGSRLLLPHQGQLVLDEGVIEDRDVVGHETPTLLGHESCRAQYTRSTSRMAVSPSWPWRKPSSRCPGYRATARRTRSTTEVPSGQCASTRAKGSTPSGPRAIPSSPAPPART